MDWAMAGAAIRLAAAAAVPAVVTKRRLSMIGFLLDMILDFPLPLVGRAGVGAF